MAAAHPEKFSASSVDETSIQELVDNFFLKDKATMLWRPAQGEELPTPNTNEIVVLKPYFQRGFGLPSCSFLRLLLEHYQIELVNLHPNSILQIAIFVHFCEAFLAISPDLDLFKYYFFLKLQPSAADPQIFGGVGLQARPNRQFLPSFLKSSLKGWHSQWFYCANHQPVLPSFVGSIPEYKASWKAAPDAKVMTAVLSQVARVNRYRELGLTGVMVAANWLIRRVIPLKEQSHPAWDYTGLDDSTCETSKRLGERKLRALLGDLFTDVSNWALPDGVGVFNAGVDRCAVRFSYSSILADSSSLLSLLLSDPVRSLPRLF